MHEAPPHILTTPDNRVPSAHIEEVMESHMFQVIGNEEDMGSREEDPDDIFEVFATERKKREPRHSKLPEMQLPAHPSAPTSAESSSPVPVPSTAIPTTSPSATASAPARMAPQYWYQSMAEDCKVGCMAGLVQTISDASVLA